MTAQLERTWVSVCRYDQLVPERGVAALVDGEQVALFRTFDGMLYAIGNRDPFSGAFVLSRGIVGSAGDAPTVASPVFKQVFDLRTGRAQFIGIPQSRAFIRRIIRPFKDDRIIFAPRFERARKLCAFAARLFRKQRPNGGDMLRRNLAARAHTGRGSPQGFTQHAPLQARRLRAQQGDTICRDHTCRLITRFLDARRF